MRTVYLGTSAFAAAVLERLADSPHRPQLVVSRPDSRRGRGRRLQPPPVVETARAHGLETFQPATVNSEEARVRIAGAAPEAVCVCAFGALIKEPLLSDHRMLNVHPSLLPRWRGAAPVERAIMAGDERTGVSIMILTAGLDSGPVCRQSEIEIGPEEDYGSVAEHLKQLGGEDLVAVLDEDPEAVPQPEDGVTYADKITPEDRHLHPERESAAALARRIRALTPHIGAYLELPAGACGRFCLADPAGGPVFGGHVAPKDTPRGQQNRPERASTPCSLRRGRTRAADSATAWPAFDVRGGVPARPAAVSVAPARTCAYEVLRRVFEQGAFADRALHGAASELDRRDRALAMALVFGTVQRQRTLDHVLAKLSSRPLQRLEPAALAALRLGAYQLLFLDGVSDYAAVDDSVELAKHHSRGGAPTVNAVLRRAAREGQALLAAIDDSTPAGAAILHSVPDWLAGLWWRELGAEEAVAVLRSVNEPAETALRVNTLRAAREAVIEALPVQASTVPELPEGLVIGGPFDAHGSELWRDGAIMPQSRASMLVSRMLDPRAGDRVLDLCAAPGGKTTHLAALMEDQGEVVAVEVHARRAQALARTCEQMGTASVRVLCEDGRELNAGQFDRVLVDPPCSGLGTLQTRPDLRWQPRRGQLATLAVQQAQLLRAAADAVAPGGTLVYSVCTISRTESAGVVDDLLAERDGIVREEQRQLLPSRDRTDGFFMARLTRCMDRT